MFSLVYHNPVLLYFSFHDLRLEAVTLRIVACAASVVLILPILSCVLFYIGDRTPLFVECHCALLKYQRCNGYYVANG